MTIRKLKISLAACWLTALVLLSFASAHAAEILRGEAGNPGAASHAILTVFSKIAGRETGVSIQINDSQTLTKSVLKMGLDQIDISPMPPAAYNFLSAGTRMYSKVSEQAKSASQNIRSIMGFLANFFHPVVFENVPITTWADIKDKRVFTGPPAGAAAVNAEEVIRIVTGYEPNKQYKAIRLNWGSGLQAMMDGQLDVYMRPVGVGAAMIEQLGLKRKFRLLSLSPEILKSEAWRKYEEVPGRGSGIIPARTYKGQLGDNDVLVAANAMLLVVRKGLDNELVYRMTKAFWENLEEVQATVNTLKTVSLNDPINSVTAPLHVGALRYYREVGISIPEKLVPPEAR